MENYVGSLISVDCGAEMGTLEGRIASFDASSGMLTLDKPFRAGKPCSESSMSILASTIRDLSVVRLASDFGDDDSTLVRIPRAKPRRERRAHTPPPLSPPSTADAAPPDANPLAALGLVHASSRVKPQSSLPHDAFSQHRKRAASTTFQASKTSSDFEAELFGLLSQHNVNLRGRGAKDSHLLKPVDVKVMQEDFDFEANLALFDKPRFMAEIGGSGEAGGRKVRSKTNGTAAASGAGAGGKGNYRHDENVVKDPGRVTSWVTQISGGPFSVKYQMDSSDEQEDEAVETKSATLAAIFNGGSGVHSSSASSLDSLQAPALSWTTVTEPHLLLPALDQGRKALLVRQAVDTAFPFLSYPALAAQAAVSTFAAISAHAKEQEVEEKLGTGASAIVGLGDGEDCWSLVGALGLAWRQRFPHGKLCLSFPALGMGLPTPGEVETGEAGPGSSSVRVVERSGSAGLPRSRGVAGLVLVGGLSEAGAGWEKDALLAEWLRAALGGKGPALLALVELSPARLPARPPSAPLCLRVNWPCGPKETASSTSKPRHAVVHVPLLRGPLPTPAFTPSSLFSFIR